MQKNGLRMILRMFGPLLIAYLISGFVTSAFSMWYMGQMWPEIQKAQEQGMDAMAITEQVMEKLLPHTNEIMAAAALVTIPVMIILFLRDIKKRKAAGIAQPKKEKIWKYGAIIVLAAAACIALNNLMLIANVTAVDEQYQQTARALYSSAFWIRIIGNGFLVPISEELVFRGVFYNRLKEVASIKKAAVITCLIFAVYHGNLVQMIYAGIMSAMMIFVYEKYGSVKAPIAAHIVANLVSVIFSEFGVFDAMFTDVMYAGIFTVICATLCTATVLFIQKITEPSLEETK